MRSIQRLTLLVVLPLVCGCAGLVSRATSGLTNDLSLAIRSHDDPETVREGAPAYLLMSDGLIERSPDNVDLLLSGASLYGAYASAFVEDPARARRLASRSREYAQRALCLELRELCGTIQGPFDAFAAELARVGAGDLDVLYGFGSAWAGWVQVYSDDWKAVAEVPKIQASMQRVVELDDGYDRGAPHLYLGVLSTLRPAAMGGQPEQGRAQFERAIELSNGRNLMAKVYFAERYARLVFDRELHDRLLQEVIEADPREPGLTLQNTLAQERARVLLEGSSDYF